MSDLIDAVSDHRRALDVIDQQIEKHASRRPVDYPWIDRLLELRSALASAPIGVIR